MTVSIPNSTLFAAEAQYLAAANGLDCAAEAEKAGFFLACNEPAHGLCADKHAAHDFFASHGFAQPQDFPAGSEPFIVKPAKNACGRGIWSTEDFCEAGGGINAGFLVQEELRGTICSVTILGHAGRVCVCPAVELIMDDRYDRCGAAYPVEASKAKAAEALARTLGEALALDGAMELKVILSGGEAVIVSVNEGIGALAATALHFGAGLDPIAALAAMHEGREPVWESTPCRVTLEVDGRACGLRSAERVGELQYTEDCVTDGRVRLLIES